MSSFESERPGTADPFGFPDPTQTCEPDHSFRDATPIANLSESGFYMLGWGPQFIDGELDGDPDLIVINGHVHQPSDAMVPYRMPSQYFRNLGNSRFEEQPAETLGPYFQGRHLGRAVARLDWNRDGLEDACISNLDAPVALLENCTSPHGHYLVVHLVGTSSSRGAIGTTVCGSGERSAANSTTHCG